MTRPTTAHQPGRRAQVLGLLREANSPLGIAQIADRLAIHANTVRFHLDTLVAGGQVERTATSSGSPGRPAQLFVAVRQMDPAGPRHYRALAEVLATSLATSPDPHTRSLEAGRVWGRGHATGLADTAPLTDTAHLATSSEHPDAAEAIDHLMVMLDELDFAPEQLQSGEHSQIGLRRCPFLELALDRSEIVCPIHLGLMQGAMETWGAPVTVDRLDAFAEPDLCIAHLTTIGAS